jgi:sec-independent protein translocase protein TatA
MRRATRYDGGMPSGPEWIIVLAIVLLIFGGTQVPKLARNLGKAQKEFKDGLADAERAERSAPPVAPGVDGVTPPPKSPTDGA